MPGGNPNHDPRTGKFTSRGGSNVVNSTTVERAAGSVASAIRSTVGFGADLVVGTAVAIGHAAIEGVTRSVRHHALVATNRYIVANYPRVDLQANEATNDVIHHTKMAALRASRSIGGGVEDLASVARSASREFMSRFEPPKSSMWSHEESQKTLSSHIKSSPLWAHEETGGVPQPSRSDVKKSRSPRKK